LNDFASFDELNFDDCIDQLNISILTIHPVRKIILNKSLNKLKNLKINQIQENFILNLKNFKAFDLRSNPFREMKNLKNYENIIFIIENSELNFIFDSSSSSSSSSSNYLFQGYFTIIEDSNDFSNHIDPLVFRNSFLNKLRIEGISSSLYNKNEFIFSKSSKNNETYLFKSFILFLDLSVYRIRFTNRLLNEKVYENLFSLELNGIVDSIQDDLFKNLNSLKLLIIRMQYIKNIFMKNNKWLQFLNYNQKITKPVPFNQTFFLILFQSLPRVTYYEYPNEDFCYFKDFPHEKIVLPVLKPSHNLTCSCTQLYLIQYSYLLKNRFDANFEHINPFLIVDYQFALYYADYLSQETFKDCLKNVKSVFRKRLVECNFSQRLELCNTKFLNPSTKQDFYFTIYDWELLSKKSHLYLFILNQVISVVCICANFITIIVISNNSKQIRKEFQKTYKYLRIYSLFNCLHILILFTKFICFKDIFHCYITKDLLYVQLIKLIAVRLIANILKTASNITYVSFTLSRYLSITNSSNDSNLLKIFEKISFKLFFTIVIIFSGCINGYVYFISPIKETSLIYSSQNITMNSYKWESVGDYKQNFETSNHQLLNGLQIIRILFSDIAYIVLVFIIDCCLLFFVTQQMKQKIALLIQNHNSNHLNDSEAAILMCQKMRQIKNSENRISAIIVLNGINFLVFKLPSALIGMYGFVYVYDQTNKIYKPNLIDYIVCRHFKFCECVAELTHLFYLLSYLNQFFIFYKLDKNFNDNFKCLVLRIKQNFSYNNRSVVEITRL
jgi:hypothetical protein